MEQFPKKTPEDLAALRQEAESTEFTSEDLEEMSDYIRTEEERVRQMIEDEKKFRSEYEILLTQSSQHPDDAGIQSATKGMKDALDHFAKARQEIGAVLSVVKQKFQKIPKN